MKEKLIIAVDFDGTVTKHKYPEIGEDIGAAPVLRDLVKAGHKLILYTMRSGQELRDAVEWFKFHGILLYGVNSNPEQHSWTTSPKCYANLYIDDAALGCPLAIESLISSGRPWVDWVAVREKLAYIL